MRPGFHRLLVLPTGVSFQFLSRAVMTGYLTGLGISVITNQFRRILGAADIEKLGLSAFGQQIQETMASSVNTTGYFAELIVLFKSIPYLNLYSVAVGLGTMVFIRWMKKSFPRIPAALLALVLMTGVVAIFSLDQKGIQVLGAIPSGLPSLSLPHVPLLDYLRLLPGAIAVVAITLCEGCCWSAAPAENTIPKRTAIRCCSATAWRP